MRMPLRTRWRMFVLTRTAVNGSSQRATSSRPTSTARPVTTRSAIRGDDGLRLVVVACEQDVLVQRMIDVGERLRAQRREPGDDPCLRSGARGQLGQRQLARLGERLALADADRSRDADDDPPGQLRRQIAGGRLDAAGRRAQEHDVRRRRLGVRDRVALRVPRADRDLLPGRAQAAPRAPGRSRPCRRRGRSQRVQDRAADVGARCGLGHHDGRHDSP